MSDLWRFAPLVPFSETLSFLTDIQSAVEAEYRTSVRHARMIYQMRHLMTNEAGLEAEGIFDVRRTATFRVPAWGEATEFAEAPPAGGTVLQVNPADWRPGGQAMILASDGQAEVIGITAVGLGTITLAFPPSRPIRFLMPIRTCKAMAGLQGARVFRALSERTASFATQDNVDLSGHDLPVVDGLIVLDDAGMDFRGAEHGVVHPVETIDEGPGGLVIVPLRPGADHRAGIAFVDSGPAKVWRRRRFWHALRGRATAFWLPSFQSDFRLLQPVGAASLTVRVAAPAWSPAQLVGRVLCLDDGAGRIHRKVQTVSVLGVEWLIGLAATTGRLLPAGARVSIARRMRLESDDVQLLHEAPGMQLMKSSAICVGVP